jgi:hypothetical protein
MFVSIAIAVVGCKGRTAATANTESSTDAPEKGEEGLWHFREVVDERYGGRTTTFVPDSLDSTKGWLARLILAYEQSPSESRVVAERALQSALESARGKSIAWMLVLGAPDYCIGGRYVLPIFDERDKAHHFLYISASARDKRAPVLPNPFWDDRDKWDGEVFRLLPDVDVSRASWEKMTTGGGSDILVKGKIKGMRYVPKVPSYISIYLDDCVT